MRPCLQHHVMQLSSVSDPLFPPLHTHTRKKAARLAGLERVSLLQEPVAAAMAFGFGKPEEAETILVFDLGGGTYDISILESFEGIMEVLSSAGDSQLGGDDFDRALFGLLLGRLSDSSTPAAAAAAAADPSAAARLLAAAEAAKVRLSSCPEAAMQLPDLGAAGGPPALSTTVTAAEFIAATAPLRARLWPPLAAAAGQCKLSFVSTGESFERQLAGATASSSGSSSSSSTEAAAAAVAVAAVDKYAPKPRVATAAVLVGGATRAPVIRDYVRHVTGLTPRWEGTLDDHRFLLLVVR